MQRTFTAERSLIDAMISAAEAMPATRLVVASESHPADTTLAEVVREGRIMGEHLRAACVAQGDVIAVQLPAWREWLVACVAVAQAGAVLLPIVASYGAKELGFVLRQSRARLIITPDQWRRTSYAEVLARCGALPDLAGQVVIGTAWPGCLQWKDLVQGCEAAPPVPRGAADLAMLIYTSGTTADPKGVLHSNRTLLAEISAFSQIRRCRGVEEVVLTPWPPGHIAGACQMLRFLTDGLPLVAMDSWDPAQAAMLIDRHQVTTSSGTPFHLAGLLDAAESQGCALSSLTTYTLGAAPVPSALVARCAARGLATFRSYGSTEHPTVTAGDPSDALDKRLSTEGRLMTGCQLRIVDDEGRDVAEGAGEIVSRGPELFLGYLDPDLNAAAFLPGGWYRSGDIGRMDPDGFLVIADRKKDVIIRGGENISSREVEDMLLTHPAIAEAAVVAAPDRRMGEVVRACLVLRPGMAMTLDEVRSHFAAAGMSRQKTPEQIAIIDAMPRNATGKVLKHTLRAMARGTDGLT